jgi:uncharacterized protein (DUF433 family)
MSTITDIGTLITQTPGVCGGRPCIAGAGVSVRRVAGWYKMGRTPEEIAAEYGHLTLSQVYAALTYYHANREAVDAELADEDSEYDRLATAAKSQNAKTTAAE